MIPCPGFDGAASDAAVRAVIDTMVREGTRDLGRPHVVIVRHPDGTILGVLGPCPDALSAAVAAERECRSAEREGVHFSVALAPLLAPTPA